MDGRIVIDNVSKRYRNVQAVSGLSFTVEPGNVTGFLGPNGAGKSTTLRILTGLADADSGQATIGGHSYRQLADPIRQVGALLEPAFHPGRSARNHLRYLCDAAGLPTKRADEVLDLVGLASASRRRTGGFSLGMKQRLGVAAALLGDPKVLVLDEPANGLDPEGIAWIRDLLRALAKQGRTIVVSSHVLAEMQQTVDCVVIVARGQLVAQGTIAELSGSTQEATVVSGPDLQALLRAADARGARVVSQDGDTVRLVGLSCRTVGELAHQTQTLLYELRDDGKDLEKLYFQLTSGHTEFASAQAGAA